MQRKKNISIIILILLIAAILRFYNLMHDSPYFFNPDERNMAGAITQFHLPAKFSQIPICLISQIRQITTDNCNLNPHFFAYGQFPLYLAYVSDQAIKLSSYQAARLFNVYTPNNSIARSLDGSLTTSFPSAIFWLRFWSALSSILTVLLVYFITKELIANHQIKFPLPTSHF